MLVIPPGWKVVWKSKNHLESIQVKCVDEKGRSQYIYHPLWVVLSSQLKFKRLCKFARVVNRISRRSTPSDDMEQLIKFMIATNIRVGSDKYAKDNNTFGVSTLKVSHVKDHGGYLELKFKGKSGHHHDIKVSREPYITFIRRKISEAKKSGDKRLFSSGTSERLRCKFKELFGSDFNPKDLRTYNANDILVKELKKCSGVKLRKDLISSTKKAAEKLHHTASVCRSNYLCPQIMNLWMTRPEKIRGSSFGEIIKYLKI